MKAAIFDLDGTLVDTLKLHTDTFMTVCKNHNIPVAKEFVEKRFGKAAKEILEDVCREQEITCDPEKLAQEKYDEFNRLASTINLLPGVTAFLDRLNEEGVKMAIATGAGSGNTGVMLEKSGLSPYFDTVVTANDVMHTKPYPDLFLKAARLIGEIPEDCIVFEDAPLGIKAAKAAGMRCVLLLTGLMPREELEALGPDLIFKDFTEALDAFDKI